MKIGDMMKSTYRGAHFFGLVLEHLETGDPITGESMTSVVIWRPELPVAQQYQTWVLNDAGEVVYESR